ncbi:MAG: hypothetical protein DI637_06165, partial [Citromicrobium sp.]
LGAAQQAWLADGMKRSARAGKPWQVLVQQVLMGQLATAPALTENLPGNLPDYIRQRIQAGVMASRAELPLNMDAWDGYPAARERVFEAALASDANLISLAGDTHHPASKAISRMSHRPISNVPAWRITASSNGWMPRAAVTWRSN